MQDGVTPRASDTRWATADLLALEARILATAQAGVLAGRAVVPDTLAAAHATAAGLDAEQTQVMRRLTTGGQLVAVLIAPAGAGKTTTLGASAAAWTAAGYDVVGLAPSARAAAELAGRQAPPRTPSPSGATNNPASRTCRPRRRGAGGSGRARC